MNDSKLLFVGLTCLLGCDGATKQANLKTWESKGYDDGKVGMPPHSFIPTSSWKEEQEKYREGYKRALLEKK